MQRIGRAMPGRRDPQNLRQAEYLRAPKEQRSRSSDAFGKPTVNTVVSYALSLPRQELKILVGLLTGHITLNTDLTVMKIQEDPLCPACGEQED